MIIDTHTHIYSRQLRENREKYFPVDPVFKRFYDSPKARIAGAKDLIDSMDKNSVDLSVIFGFPWSNISVLKKQNDYIMETVIKYPGRFLGFCCLDPFIKEAVSEVERCIAGGLKGVGELFFHKSGIDDRCIKTLGPIMEICRNKDMPVLIHTNEPIGHSYPGKTPLTLGQIYNLVKRYPENKIILAHLGGGLFFYNLLKKEIKDSLKNVYFDTAVAPFLYENPVYKIAVEIMGKEKIILGTDFPIGEADQYFKAFLESTISEAEIAGICGENAKKLLKL